LNRITRAFDGSAPGDAVVECLAEAGAPYADRVMALVKLDKHQESQIAPKDAIESGIPWTNFAPLDFFREARGQELTTFVTQIWILEVTGSMSMYPIADEEFKIDDEGAGEAGVAQ
jgi:hypothetical protein